MFALMSDMAARSGSWSPASSASCSRVTGRYSLDSVMRRSPFVSTSALVLLCPLLRDHRPPRALDDSLARLRARASRARLVDVGGDRSVDPACDLSVLAFTTERLRDDLRELHCRTGSPIGVTPNGRQPLKAHASIWIDKSAGGGRRMCEEPLARVGEACGAPGRSRGGFTGGRGASPTPRHARRAACRERSSDG